MKQFIHWLSNSTLFAPGNASFSLDKAATMRL